MANAVPVAIITGGAKGIGRAIAEHLLEQKWRVVVVDLAGSGARRAFPARNHAVALVEGDVGHEDTAKRAVAEALSRFGRLDALVSNAGIMIRKPLRRLTPAEWRKVIDTNLTATFLFARAGEAALRRSKGAIVTIASTRALMSEPDTESYSASKGGIVALTHALAVSLGPDVRVTCVSPGWIHTEIEGYEALRKKRPRPASGRPRRQARGCCRAGRVSARSRAIGLHHGGELRHRRRHDAEDDLRGVESRAQ